MLHGEGKLPYIGITFAISSGRRQNGGSIHVFEEGVPYAEIVLGDLGPGINKRLKKFMPANYNPMFSDSSNHLLTPERIVSFGFEFASTSDYEARRKRIKKILDSEYLDPSAVATGLFCAMGVVRSRGGQLLVRTPDASLSLVFAGDEDKPLVKGRKQMGIKTIADLPGTHFLLRIPFIERQPPNSTRLFMEEVIINKRDTYCLDPSLGVDVSDDYASLIHKSFETIEEFLRSHRDRGGLLLVRPFRELLSPRAWAVFLLGLRSMILGRVRLVIMDPTALSTELGIFDSPVTDLSDSLFKQGILIGDLFANRFIIVGRDSPPWWSMLGREVEGSFAFAESVRETLVEKSQEFLKTELEGVLVSSEVRLEPGPFFVEEQYYTDVFYHIAQALGRPIIHKKVVEWCLGAMWDDVEVLVAANRKMYSVVEHLALEMRRYCGRDIKVLRAASWNKSSELVQVLSLAKRNAVLITDVICRGISIRRVAERLSYLDVRGIITFIDARGTDDIGEPIAIGYNDPKYGGARKLVPVNSIHWEVITPSYTPFYGGEFEAEERVYVVDPVVGTPTLYKRQIKPAITPREVLGPVMRECGGLRIGHLGLRDKHYSVFLDFPRLFAAMEDRIKLWVQEQVSFLKRGREGELLHLLLYDMSDSIPWLSTYLRELNPGCQISEVTWGQISAPALPRQDKNFLSFVIVLPATESGETARRCIEYASRFSPQNILLLAVVSRMSPYQLNFFIGVSSYYEAKFRASFFFDLPIRAYDVGAGTCPMCTEVSELERLLGVIRRTRPATLHLEESLSRKIALLRAQPVERLLGEEVSRQVSERDCDRAYLRYLYEAAELDHDAHVELVKVLDGPHLDRFLEVLSIERRSRHFAQGELRRRLGARHERLVQRAVQLLKEASPPFPIGRFVGAFTNVVPREFVEHAANLVVRFSLAERDVEDICIGLLESGEEPPGLAEVVSTLDKDGNQKMSSILIETREFLRGIWAPDEDAVQVGVDALADFIAGLFRSGFFSDYCREIGQGAWTSEINLSVLYKCERIVGDWKDRIAIYISKVQSAPFWGRFVNQHGKFTAMLRQIQSEILELEVLVKSVYPGLKSGDELYEHLWRGAQKVNRTRIALLEISRRLFPVPSESGVSMPRVISLADGGQVHIERDIDWSAPEIFCDTQALEYIVAEVTTNWIKYGVGHPHLLVRIAEREQFVVFEFEDDIAGSLDFGSPGGLRAMKEICETYGGKFETENLAGGKVLRLKFRKAPKRRLDDALG